MNRIFRKIKDFPYNLRRGMKNIIKWTPLIWKDRDFDHQYLMDVIQFKLSNMEKFFNSKYTWSKDAPKVAKQIHIALLLINRLNNVDYDSLANGNMRNACYLEKQDHEYLFKYISKYLRNWWD